jgi:4'-phosphopantetheinyl transferase
LALLKNHDNIDYKYQLWEIDTDLTKSIAAFKVFPKYHPNISSYKNHFRVNQILNTRHIVKRIVGENIELTQNIYGKPLLSNSNLHISITNHKKFIAVIVAKFLCGIDIESKERNLTEIQHKYINQLDLLSNNQNIDLTKIWCGKEVLYKIHGNPIINFKKHLCLTKNNSEIIGRCEHDDISFKANLNTVIHHDLLLMFNSNYQGENNDD